MQLLLHVTVKLMSQYKQLVSCKFEYFYTFSFFIAGLTALCGGRTSCIPLLVMILSHAEKVAFIELPS